MSFGGHGGRTRVGTKVLLNVYDLGPANDMLYPIGFGLHHSGVEILGSEYSFASGAGVFENTPKEAPGALYRETIELGAFDGGQAELKLALEDVKRNFGPDDYNLIRKNCNHFANALVWKLLGRQIPAYVNRLADIGVCCSCFFPRKMLEQAPVGDPNAKSSTGFQAFAPRGARLTQSTISTPSFAGKGSRLGGESETKGSTSQLLGTTNRSASPRGDDLTDRRERARKAALARLELQQKEQEQKVVSGS